MSQNGGGHCGGGAANQPVDDSQAHLFVFRSLLFILNDSKRLFFYLESLPGKDKISLLRMQIFVRCQDEAE